MSLHEFDTLLKTHPAEEAQVINALEAAITAVLLLDRNARLDVGLVLHHLRHSKVTPVHAKRLLVELVREKALQQVLFWECPNGRGPILEASQIAEFPDSVDCDRCGQLHWFDTADVQVGFAATARLREEITTHSA